VRHVPLFGRSDLVGTVETRLAAGGGVALHGPPGIGRSAVLDAVAVAAEGRDERVLRLGPARTERTVAYAGIADLIAQLPAEAAAPLPPAQRTALAALRQGLPPRAGSPALARRLVLPLLLAHAARDRPLLLVLDDVQWLDAESAELIAFAMRRRPGPRVRVLAAERRPGPAGTLRAARLCPPPVAELAVPPLAADDLVRRRGGRAGRGQPVRGRRLRPPRRARLGAGGRPHLPAPQPARPGPGRAAVRRHPGRCGRPAPAARPFARAAPTR
jgi:hypothetical protein